MNSSDRVGQMMSTVDFLASEECEGRAPGTSGGLLARRFVTEKLRGLDLKPMGVEGFHQVIPAISGANIIGVVPSQRPSDRFILIGAHYDHLGTHFDTIHPGADDNASGVAVLLDVTARLQNRREELRRNVLVISFDAEEPPHFYSESMGSIFYTNNPTVPLGSIDLMLCLDVIGHGLGQPGMARSLRKSLFVSGAERSGLSPLIDSYHDEGLIIRRLAANIVPALSDHYAFQNVGIASIFFNAGRDRHYHTPEDTAEKLDYQRMLALADMLANFIVDVSQAPGSIEYFPNATDDPTSLETLRFLADHVAESIPMGDRAVDIVTRLSQKSGKLSTEDRALATRVLERFEMGLA